jgi:hypothetical protein
MKKHWSVSVLALIFLLFVLAGCATLKPVNDFSSASLNGIKKFEEINYSFQQHCMERCWLEAARNFDIRRDTECDCGSYKKADNITQQIYSSLKNYFSGLANLSDNRLTDYNFKALENSLTKGDFGDISIEDEHVKAYSNLSGILLKATTDLYMSNKITKYIGEANEPVQVLLRKFQFIIQQNLEGELNFKKEKLLDYYMGMKMGNTLSDYEKGKAANDYYQQISGILAQQKQMDAFARGLNSISEGHQELYNNRNKITVRELAVRLAGYACDIQDIISEFNKLKN